MRDGLRTTFLQAGSEDLRGVEEEAQGGEHFRAATMNGLVICSVFTLFPNTATPGLLCSETLGPGPFEVKLIP
ncbi:unnamed protein product [Lota lota]